MLPTFFLIGAMKAGTTTLYEYLRRHPRIFMPEKKEPRYFIEERGGRKGLEWYEALFADAGDATAVGEASPGYTRYPRYRGVPERMAALVPDASFLYLVRDPVARTISHYEHQVIAGHERRPPEEALLDPFYVDPSRYAFQLEQYLPHFPPERFLLLQSDELSADPGAILARIAAFLGVDAAWPAADLAERHNVTKGKARRRAGTFKLVRSRRGRRLARRLPAQVKRTLRRLTHDRDLQIEIPEPLVRELEARLREDVEALSEHWLGPGFDCWGLRENPRVAAPVD